MLEQLDLIPMHYLISTPWLPGTSLKNSEVPATGDMEVCSSAAQRNTAVPGGLASNVPAEDDETPPTPTSLTVKAEVVTAIESMIGKIARPKRVYIVPDMPKTRSGKIMRRVLAAISNTLDIGDVQTLANPDIVEEIRVLVQGKEKLATRQGPEDLVRFGEEK